MVFFSYIEKKTILNIKIIFSKKFMSDLNEQKEMLLRRLREEMAVALVNNPNVRLCIENFSFMNLTHLITDKDLVIDLESIVNTILNKEINEKVPMEIPVTQIKTNFQK